jgi:Cu/Ag efflux protein CusF
MTMTFTLERPEVARSITVGETVSFRFRQDGSRYVIVEISEAGARP